MLLQRAKKKCQYKNTAIEKENSGSCQAVLRFLKMPMVMAQNTECIRQQKKDDKEAGQVPADTVQGMAKCHGTGERLQHSETSCKQYRTFTEWYGKPGMVGHDGEYGIREGKQEP